MLLPPGHRPSRSHRIGLIPLAAALAVLAYAVWPDRPGPVERPRAKTAAARSGTIARKIRISGMMAARRSATFVAPRVRGSRGRSLAGGDFRLVLESLVPPGSRVRTGQVVAAFDLQYMETRLDELRADIRQRELTNQRIDASTAVRRASLDQRIRNARATLEKAGLNLKTIPVRSAMQAERYRIAHEEAQANLDHLLVQRKWFDQAEMSQLRREELMLRDAVLDLERAAENLDRMVFRAPLDGAAIMGTIQRGHEQAEIQPGDEIRAGHAFLQVVDTSSLYLAGQVSQADGQKIRPGARATIHLDAVPSFEMPGRVVTVGALATTTRYRPGWVSSLAVQVEPDAPDPRVFANASASADIVLDSEQAPAVVARECVAEATEDSGYVLIRTGDGDGEEESWVRRPVELGLASNNEVAVRTGLAAGDVVACGAF